MAPSAEFLNAARSREVDGGMLTPQMRGVSMYEGGTIGSRGPSPFVVPGSGRSGTYQDETPPGLAGTGPGRWAALGSENEGGHATNELPPPFTTGSWNDPLYEKLSDAARQREELYRAAGYRTPPLSSSSHRMPMPEPSTRASHDTVPSTSSLLSSPTRTHSSIATTPQGEHYIPYVDQYQESDDEEAMKQTSPILNPNKISRMSMQESAQDLDPRARTKSMAGEIGWAA